jgi:hypothetical protein
MMHTPRIIEMKQKQNTDEERAICIKAMDVGAALVRVGEVSEDFKTHVQQTLSALERSTSSAYLDQAYTDSTDPAAPSECGSDENETAVEHEHEDGNAGEEEDDTNGEENQEGSSLDDETAFGLRVRSSRKPQREASPADSLCVILRVC